MTVHDQSTRSPCMMLAGLQAQTQSPTRWMLFCLSLNFANGPWSPEGSVLIKLLIAAYRFWPFWGRPPISDKLVTDWPAPPPPPPRLSQAPCKNHYLNTGSLAVNCLSVAAPRRLFAALQEDSRTKVFNRGSCFLSRRCLNYVACGSIVRCSY